jgi:hypothetical protein
MELSALATIASNHTILARLPLTTISKFFTIVNIARPTIQFTRRDTNLDEPPLELSRKLISLFAHLLGVDEICVIECWKVFREEAWREASGIEPDLAFIAEYNKAALPLDMGECIYGLEDMNQPLANVGYSLPHGISPCARVP